jgi:hypothetical protein
MTADARSPQTTTTARSDRRFFGGMAFAFALTVLAGFSRTYYFNGFANQPFELSPLLHWHGAVYTAWMLLLVTQTLLIANGRPDLHRRLGALGALLALSMVTLGIGVAISRTASGAIADAGVPPLVFLAVPLLGMAVFTGLVGAAFVQRRNSAAHKRLMLLATLELVTAAVSRLPLVEDWGPVGFFCVTDLFGAAIVVYDFATLKRVHTATLWGGLGLVLSQPLRLVIGGTPAWLAFAAWLTT